VNVGFPQEAYDWASKRKVVLPSEYYGERHGLARAEAFSIAGVGSVEQLAEVLNSLNEHMVSGETFESWVKKVRAGQVPLTLPKHRLDNIYRTNIQSAFARGRCFQQSRTTLTHPWYMYDAVNDSRTREAHRAMDNYLAKYDDPIWEKWTPPNGYRCRCRRIALSEKQAARMKERQVQGDAQEPGRSDRRAGAALAGPDTGWDYSVCKEPQAGTQRAVTRVRKKPVAKPPVVSTPKTAEKVVDAATSAPKTLDDFIASGANALQALKDAARVPYFKQVSYDAVAFARVQKALADLLKPRIDPKVKVRFELLGTDTALQEQIPRAVSVLPSEWLQKVSSGRLKVRRIPERRSYANKNVLSIGPDVPDEVVLHEFMHYVQEKIPAMNYLFHQLWQRRTQGEELVPCYPNKKGSTEMCKKDRFINRYMGKVYTIGKRSAPDEMITMGFQYLLGQNQLNFAMFLDQDPEYAKLVLGILLHF